MTWARSSSSSTSHSTASWRTPTAREARPAAAGRSVSDRRLVAGDKFELGPILDTGVLLFGRSTWELFSRLWPPRTTDFAAAMNRIPKVVVSHSTRHSTPGATLRCSTATWWPGWPISLASATSSSSAAPVSSMRSPPPTPSTSTGCSWSRPPSERARPLFATPVDLQLTSIGTVGARTSSRGYRSAAIRTDGER